jgi:hypothetical protein
MEVSLTWQAATVWWVVRGGVVAVQGSQLMGEERWVRLHEGSFLGDIGVGWGRQSLEVARGMVERGMRRVVGSFRGLATITLSFLTKP